MAPTDDESRHVNEQIATKLRRQIDEEQWEPGHKLPSVRDLADRFQVSAATASKALQLLSKWGIVHRDSTRGYFVSSRTEPAAEDQPRNPEFIAIMKEIEAVRNDVRGLREQVQRLEGKIQP